MSDEEDIDEPVSNEDYSGLFSVFIQCIYFFSWADFSFDFLNAFFLK